MQRVILHCDLNCFYASVEMLYHPELKNKPMAVAGDSDLRHGIILAKNVLAKEKGIKAGDVIFKAQQKCPNLIIIKPDYDKYYHYSKLVQDLYYEYTDKVEPFGLDECWLDISHSINYFGSIMKIVTSLLIRIKKEIGLTLSIGVSFNKIYAKLGSDLAKENDYYVIEKSEDIYHLDASLLLGVGKKTATLLKHYHINTIGDIANKDINYLSYILGKYGEALYYFSIGQDLNEVKQFDTKDNMIKSIGNSTTTIRDLNNLDDIKMVITILADNISSRCKDSGLFFKVIKLSLRNNKLQTRTMQKKLYENTNLSRDIYKNALDLFINNCDFILPYRSIGISVSDLSFQKEDSEINIFDENASYSLKELKKEEAIKTIRKRFGYNKISTLRLLEDINLTHFNPELDNNIHPINIFKE